MWVWLLAAVMCITTGVMAGAQDAEGSKDHPMLSRFPNYVITNYGASDFGSHRFEDGADGVEVEGKYWRISYGLEEGKKKGGPLEISRNYLKTFTGRGGSKLYEAVDAGGQSAAVAGAGSRGEGVPHGALRHCGGPPDDRRIRRHEADGRQRDRCRVGPEPPGGACEEMAGAQNQRIRQLS